MDMLSLNEFVRIFAGKPFFTKTIAPQLYKKSHSCGDIIRIIR